MKKITVLLTTALFIVTVLLISVMLSKKAEADGDYDFKCSKTGIVEGNYTSRCENKEAVCYFGKNAESVSCFKK